MLVQLKEELADCLHKQVEAQKTIKETHERIANLRQSIAAISKLCGEEFNEEDALGLTDAIRQLFKETMDRPMTAQDVRTGLESRGFNVSRYGNSLASIHTVLK